MNKNKKLKILFAASEAVPYIKSGGLADVSGALPKAIKELGHDVRIVLPRYWSIDKEKYSLDLSVSPMGVKMGNCEIWCEVYKSEIDGITVYFIEHDHYFGRAGLYDDGKKEYHDNAERFGFFSKACIQLCEDVNFKVDIVHCNDWQTAMIPSYLKSPEYKNGFFRNTASVFTIHNIGYQGIFKKKFVKYLGINKEDFDQNRFESYNHLHLMKGAIFYADCISTVSPTYAEEIMTDIGGNGLAEYIERRREDTAGILNGADYEHWDPEIDKLIPANYSINNISGKAECKKALQKEFMLKEMDNVPVIGIVSRMAQQKGLHLLAPVIESIVKDMIVQFAILGSGEKHFEDYFGGLPAKYPGVVGTWIGYNNRKSHLIEAGSDFFLMPSIYEPCGLNQIYSMKYGTLPIVRETGGLKDTVENYEEETGSGTGFSFNSINPSSVYYSVGWAVSTYYDRPEHFKKMQKTAMRKDYSWKNAAAKYEDLYRKAIDRRATWS